MPNDESVTRYLPDESGMPSVKQTALEWVATEGRCHFSSIEH